jgi:hypothetical protein
MAVVQKKQLEEHPVEFELGLSDVTVAVFNEYKALFVRALASSCYVDESAVSIAAVTPMKQSGASAGSRHRMLAEGGTGVRIYVRVVLPSSSTGEMLLTRVHSSSLDVGATPSFVVDLVSALEDVGWSDATGQPLSADSLDLGPAGDNGSSTDGGSESTDEANSNSVEAPSSRRVVGLIVVLVMMIVGVLAFIAYHKRKARQRAASRKDEEGSIVAEPIDSTLSVSEDEFGASNPLFGHTERMSSSRERNVSKQTQGGADEASSERGGTDDLPKGALALLDSRQRGAV